jgi:hypothetical protein
MIDHRIILHYLYHTTVECAARFHELKKECTIDTALLFFPFTRRGYYDRLNSLNASQYLQRLKILTPILGRSN